MGQCQNTQVEGDGFTYYIIQIETYSYVCMLVPLVHTYVYMHVCVDVYIHTYAHMHIHTCICPYGYMYIYVYSHVCTYIYICNPLDPASGLFIL